MLSYKGVTLRITRYTYFDRFKHMIYRIYLVLFLEMYLAPRAFAIALALILIFEQIDGVDVFAFGQLSLN